MTEYQISTEATLEIQTLNAKLITIKSLYKDAILEGNRELSDKLFTEVARTQIAYDEWFSRMEKHLKAETNPNQSWSVDFQEKKLILVG